MNDFEDKLRRLEREIEAEMAAQKPKPDSPAEKQSLEELRKEMSREQELEELSRSLAIRESDLIEPPPTSGDHKKKSLARRSWESLQLDKMGGAGKAVAVVGAGLVVYTVFALVMRLLPFLIFGGLAYGAYKLFYDPKKKPSKEITSG